MIARRVSLFALVFALALSFALPVSAGETFFLHSIGIEGCTLFVSAEVNEEYAFRVEVDDTGDVIASGSGMGPGDFGFEFPLTAPFNGSSLGITLLVNRNSGFEQEDFEAVGNLPSEAECDGDDGVDSDSSSGPDFFDPGDGRINRHAYASFAVYCDGSTAVIYPIDPGSGKAAGVLTAVEPSGLPSDDLPIGFGFGIQVFQLPSGEILVIGAPGSDGKTYSIIFDGCPATYVDAFVTFPDGTRVMTEHTAF